MGRVLSLGQSRCTDRRQFLQRTASLAAALTTLPQSSWGQEAAVASSGPASLTTELGAVARGQRAAVATVHPLATQAASMAYQRGGNAFDAAIAASLMLSVVDGANSGLGGGGLALVRTPDGSLHAVDGREKAPATASPQMFYTDGKPDPRKSQVGMLAAGVPGLLATLESLRDRFGKIPWDEALLGAAEVAEQGFVLSQGYARRLRSVATSIRRFPSTAAILLDPAGQPWQAGDRLRQADLARTLRKVAEQGTEWFYHGELAERTGKFMAESGGMLTADDFANYNIVNRQPIRSDYRGNIVIGFPPPSSGGIHNAQMLGMLSQFDVRAIFAQSEAAGRHLLVEVMKRALADRAYWLGDADFAKVPRGLLDADYLRSRAESINLEQAVAVESHGQPPRPDMDLFGPGGHTTHLTTADSDGNVVALTQTVNTSFGSKVIVPGTGVVLNNELDDFSIAPGVRNAYGLLGSEANLIAPGKRPLSSMSPTIVLDAAGSPVLTCGAAGGPKIITTVLQVLVRVLDLEQTIGQALAAPRTHHQWSPDEVVYENALDADVVQQLRDKGHTAKAIASAAVSQGIQFSGGDITAASDPRVSGAAAAL